MTQCVQVCVQEWWCAQVVRTCARNRVYPHMSGMACGRQQRGQVAASECIDVQAHARTHTPYTTQQAHTHTHTQVYKRIGTYTQKTATSAHAHTALELLRLPFEKSLIPPLPLPPPSNLSILPMGIRTDSWRLILESRGLLRTSAPKILSLLCARAPIGHRLCSLGVDSLTIERV